MSEDEKAGSAGGPAESASDYARESRIDEAWAAARAAEATTGRVEDLDDEVAARFIDAVLNEPLFCPVWDRDGGEDGADDEAQITPKMIEHEGRDTLLVFDSEDRLSSFVEEPTDFVAYPGRVFFDLARGQNAQIALNLGVAPSSTVFAPETVDAIIDLVASAEESFEIGAGQPLEVGAPTEASESLLSAVSARLAAARALVRQAWLFSVSYDGAAGKRMRHLVLGMLAAEDAGPDALRDFAGELGRLGGVLLSDEAYLDIAYFAEGERLLELARRYGVSMIEAPAGRDVSAA